MEDSAWKSPIVVEEKMKERKGSPSHYPAPGCWKDWELHSGFQTIHEWVEKVFYTRIMWWDHRSSNTGFRLLSSYYGAEGSSKLYQSSTQTQVRCSLCLVWLRFSLFCQHWPSSGKPLLRCLRTWHGSYYISIGQFSKIYYALKDDIKSNSFVNKNEMKMLQFG